MKAVVKKKSQTVEKLSKKVKKKSGDAELCEEHEIKMRDLSITGTSCQQHLSQSLYLME